MRPCERPRHELLSPYHYRSTMDRSCVDHTQLRVILWKLQHENEDAIQNHNSSNITEGEETKNEAAKVSSKHGFHCLDISGNKQLGDAGTRIALQLASQHKTAVLRATHIRCVLVNTKTTIWGLSDRSLSHLMLLALDGNCIGSTGAATIANIIAQGLLASLSVLSLSDCALGNAGAIEVVSSANMHLKQLTHIGLGYNGITDAMCEHQELTLLLKRSTCLSLHTVVLAGNSLITDAGACRMLHSILSGVMSSDVHCTQFLLRDRQVREPKCIESSELFRIDNIPNPASLSSCSNVYSSGSIRRCRNICSDGNATTIDDMDKKEGKTATISSKSTPDTILLQREHTSSSGILENVSEVSGKCSTDVDGNGDGGGGGGGGSGGSNGDVSRALPLVTLHGCDVDLDPILQDALLAPGTCGLDVRVCSYACGSVSGITRLQHSFHEAACHLRPTRCDLPHCSVVVPFCAIKTHRAVCPQELSYCSNDCGIYVARGNMTLHTDHECLKKLTPCPLECAMSIPFIEVDEHRKKHCVRRIVSCEYPDCDHVMEARKVDNHERIVHRSAFASMNNDNKKSKTRNINFQVSSNTNFDFFVDGLGNLDHLLNHLDESHLEREERMAALTAQHDKEFASAEHNRQQHRMNVQAVYRSQATKARNFWLAQVPRECQYGCGSKVLDDEYATHLKECENRPWKCELCDEFVKYKRVEKHRMVLCAERMVFCNRDGCDSVRMKAQDKDAHDREYHVNVGSTMASEIEEGALLVSIGGRQQLEQEGEEVSEVVTGNGFDVDSDEERETIQRGVVERFRLVYISYRFHCLRAARRRNGNEDMFAPRSVWCRLSPESYQ